MKNKEIIVSILMLFLVTILNGCEGINNKPLSDEKVMSAEQANITVINSTGTNVEQLHLDTGVVQFNQVINIRDNEQFQTSFPIVIKDKDLQIKIEYSDNSDKEHVITFPESSWYDHSSIVFVVELTNVSEEGEYSYTFFANEDDYSKKIQN